MLEDPEIQAAWLEYCSTYSHTSAYFKKSDQYKNQRSEMHGKSVSRKINLYALFLENCFNLLKSHGYCGIIIPTGFYSDLGTKQLREMVFSETRLDTLLGLSNEKFIFEGVHHSVKFCLLTFEKSGSTDTFEACFRINPREAIRPQKLGEFLSDLSKRVHISVDLIWKLSPDSISVMEFRNSMDVQIAMKMTKHPPLRQKFDDRWNLTLNQEINMTSDSRLFKQTSINNLLRLYEGKMIHQFTHLNAEPRYWLDEAEVRQALLCKNEDSGQTLPYEEYRIALRAVGENTNSRNFIASVIPRKVLCGHSLLVSGGFDEDRRALLVICAFFNSFVLDNAIKARIARNVSMFHIYQLTVPRLQVGDRSSQKS
ncbi:MAG: hypothetical protein HC895_03330 [Leptolyngbyaceae cyanobacterium SM1_3_5]|nr:hypothetical protein [Leptolyngbyaceae cyanobacterium SM1_3_5]